MKTLFADGKGNGRIASIPLPIVGEKEVLVKVYYCGVCGTDQDLFSGECSFAENGQVSYPVRLGHEWSGVVEAVGAGVTAFSKGDRVVGDNAVTCGECEFCKKGEYAKCKTTKNVGTIDPVYDGAFSEYFLIPERHLYRIPDELSLKEAALCEPLSVAYGAIKKMDVTPDKTVVIVGTGCIALSAAVLSRCADAKKTVVIGRNPVKLKAAEALGAITVNAREVDRFAAVRELTDGVGADFVLECSGGEGTFSDCISYACRGATVALVGFYEKREKEVNVDDIVSKALQIFGVMGEFGNMAGVLKVIGAHRPNMLPIITDELPFTECLGAFSRKNYPNSIKTMITICEEK